MEQLISGDDPVLQEFLRGKSGKNVGIPTPYRRLNQYTNGIIPRRYWLIGAESGVGKTTMADEILRSTIAGAKATGRKITVFYYSFEISKVSKLAKWVSSEIYQSTGLMLPPDYLMNRVKDKPCTPEHEELFMAGLKRVNDSYASVIHFIEDPTHPTHIFNSLIDHHFEKIGTIERHKPQSQDKKGKIKRYTPHDPDELTVVIIDHLALIGHEAGLTTKQVMDRMSSYLVTLKELFGVIPIVVQQFSTDLMSVQRMTRKDENFLTPQRLDFGDSKYTYRDADVVIGLIQPVKYELIKYQGYDCSPQGMHDNFVVSFLMKHRHGMEGRRFPLWRNGITGQFEEIDARSDDMVAMEAYFEKTKKFNEVCQLFSNSQQNGYQLND